MSQLQMIWPETRLDQPPEVQVGADYFLRTFTPEDEAAWVELMTRAGFEGWNGERLAAMILKILPDGFFLAVHRPTGQVAATAMATHNPEPLHPYGGELGWVAAEPAHRGQGLGRAVSSAVVARFLSAGYRRLYLKTDDWRLAAVKIYLQMGFVPLLYAEDMEDRWQEVYEALGWSPA